MADLTWQVLAGQALSLVALGLCIAAFSSKNDDRLLAILISANVAFAAHFVLLGGWTAAALTALILLRIVLARRHKGSRPVAAVLLALNGIAAAATWQSALDLLPLAAATFGTLGMVLLHGIPMRAALALAALCWMLNNLAIGSIGGVLAEGLILVTNLATMGRLHRDRRAQAACAAGE